MSDNDSLILEWMKVHGHAKLINESRILIAMSSGTIFVFDDVSEPGRAGVMYQGTDLAAALKALAGDE